ncbi:hypothetical protein [Pelagibius sp. Alg239-R121]|uniref:hypothetical protein n=1 Tax=Pelagibius sp. Alg239-R121 TaxID=2993448 RepID=UPI0024A64C6F|nr:hypothetical protein [Pelagibius sp. Alg239-R121]
MPTNLASSEPQDIALRAPSEVMRLKRMGSFHQSRLSFMRVLLRRLKHQGWRFDRPVWRIDHRGVGVATYRAIGPERVYTLIAFAHDLPAEQRSDRVIAEAWDATFTLFDGEPSEDDIVRLSQNVPLQEAGRISASELVLSRANRSVRLFEYVIDCLARGLQPATEMVDPIGYLMRTTAVYGSGKFGAADRDTWAERPEFLGSFQPELLSVWLIRSFTLDLVEHLAQARAPETAVLMSPGIRRRLGVGNSTGLGMAPFLLTHPSLIHAWVNARETALARVRSIQTAAPDKSILFRNLVARAAINARNWTSEHPHQSPKIAGLREDLARLSNHLEDHPLEGSQPWNELYLWAANTLSLEGQEQLVSLMLEPHGEQIDDLADTMSADESGSFHINGTLPAGILKAWLREAYGWALTTDFESDDAIARVWYVSEEKLEPRLGERFEEPLEAYEQPLAPARDAAAMLRSLQEWDDSETIAAFLMKHPEHRHAVRRAQLVAQKPYAEIRDNTIAAEMLPIDLLRCKLSFFGATKFDPRSDRWVRITMFQGAPFPEELADSDPDDLAYPPEKPL